MWWFISDHNITVFAECADVTFMDAWLPEYSKDSRGTSLVIVRSETAEEIFTSGKDISLSPIPMEKVMASQRGVIKNKRELLSLRLAKTGKSVTVPGKRVSPAPLKGVFLQLKLSTERYVLFGLSIASRIIHQK